MRLSTFTFRVFVLSIFTILIGFSTPFQLHAEGATAFPIAASGNTKGEAEPTPKKAQKLMQKAKDALLAKEVEKAQRYLEKAVKVYPAFTEARVKQAEIYTDQKDYDKAIAIYSKIFKDKPIPLNEFVIHYKIGDIEFLREDYGKAIANYEKSVAVKVPERWKKVKEKVERKLADSRFIEKAMADPVPFDPIRLDDALNTRHDEYLPMLTADEEDIYFTRRIGQTHKANEDFYSSNKDTSSNWLQAISLGSPINTAQNEGAICISPDGRYLFFAAKDRSDSEGGFDIYYCVKTGSKWRGPFNLGEPVNTIYWDSQPSISANGRELYFASRRKGGKGSIDIWMSTLKGNAWTTPVNLGENINTPGKEQTPFIHPDGQTLYFSSDGHTGMGDADLYLSRRDEEGKWGKPQNLGYPINTKGNENGLIVSASGERAYFSSFNDTMGLDLYYFDLPKVVQPVHVTYVKGKVTDSATGKPLQATIELTDLETGKVIHRILSDEINGSFLVTLPVGKNYMYNVSAEEYLFYSDNFALKAPENEEPYLIDIGLMPIGEYVVEKAKDKSKEKRDIGIGETVVLKNVFFATNSFELSSTSYPELNKLIELLQDHGDLVIEISGHTDDRGDANYNLKLSTDRARSVYDYLLDKGISSMRLRYKGYGETQPIADNETEAGRAENRRTAFTIVEKTTPIAVPDRK